MPDEIELSGQDRRYLLRALSDAFHSMDAVDGLLDDLGFPPAHRPPSTGNVNTSLRGVLQELEAGVMPHGIHDLLECSLYRYRANRIFRELAGRYAPEVLDQYPIDLPQARGPDHSAPETPVADPPRSGPPALDDLPQDDAQPPTRSLLYVRVSDDQSREKTLEVLRSFGFGPRVVASSNFTSLYALSEATVSQVERELDGSDLAWTAVAPDGPQYLLSHLIVQGPDGRSFRFSDTPAATHVADIAADVLQEYPDSGSRMTVTDRVESDGQGVRLNPDQTLHDAGLRDGDRLRVGYQTNAGSVNPAFRDDALARAANQIRAFAELNNIGVTANAPDRATLYELEFVESSFGPPPRPDAEPVPIDHHVVQIEFDADFPLLPPRVFWISEIYHPNVFPNYDCDAARSKPAYRGLVCLGELAEAYQPALNLGRLCQTLIDIAAYRNYSVAEATGGLVNRDGVLQPEFRGNAYDPEAAVWAMLHQDVVVAGGGMPLRGAEPRPSRYRHAVEPYVSTPDPAERDML